MQVRSRRDLPRRTRYYHSIMDSAFLRKGQKYSQLNPQYVIFICAYDPFNKGNATYSFSMQDEKTGLSLGDDSYTIILNTTAPKNKIPPKLKPFFMYVSQLSIDDSDDLIRDIHLKVLGINNDSEWRDALMTWEEMLEEKHDDGYEEGFEKGRDSGLKEGIDQGIEKGRKKGLKEGIKQGKEEGMQQGIQQGIQQGKTQILAELVSNGKLSYEVAVSMTNDRVELNKMINEVDRRSRQVQPPFEIEPEYPF